MLSRSIDADELYLRLGQQLATMPANIATYTQENELWLSKTVALVEAVGDLTDRAKITEIANHYREHANYYGPSVWAVLQRSLARAELAAPAASAGAFIAAGNPMDAMTAIGKVLKEARSRVVIVDPYLDQTILTDFAPMAAEGVKIDLLSDAAYVWPTLAPAAARWVAQYASRRPLEARLTSPRLLHDRLIVVDDVKVWNVTQSFKDFAKRSPASISVAPAEIASLKIPAYADMWRAATPI
ncbi:phosphatidylserine/phosphatidylglycerophosphate/cardiolipin synthase family protein [Mesorhizobium sp. M1A.T.Ca.IN.004.03.1.1]|uniref:phosphatidylserine/phosphatidylglycerophosphate/ cardiolipin synthase family protein n=1 Tax=Mesorhizobium sp. M1A.T.Ca.IN.004.03.1.1 TaxID=2496795 RepID=UPI000FCA35B3|nr:phosphatidylserine/phosphatidylglycerophosphate/cardiolipin synthase family protein [Mesorhizobium sp. M1A.T.Ca.IN.004.03.1.1]RUV41421.1 phosphatidylserine/phosphatidylglycerophosphate/cardiolipin synthase family protein [Mesorhizobium sp. M1A.T.Ca.IN.004.03.1.1]